MFFFFCPFIYTDELKLYFLNWERARILTRVYPRNAAVHTLTHKQPMLECPYIPSLSQFLTHADTALLLLYSLSVGAWTHLPSAPAPHTQTAFIPNEGLMNFLKGCEGPNWSWYVPSGRVDGAIRRSLVLPPCDSQTGPKWKNHLALLALTGQFTVY